MNEFYSCRRFHPSQVWDGKQFQITKFDEDFNVLASYETSRQGCTCKAGAAPKCRHRTMLSAFAEAGHVGDGWMIDWKTGLWWEPSGGDVAAAVEELTQAAILEAGTELFPGVTVHRFTDKFGTSPTLDRVESTLPAPASSSLPAQGVQERSDPPARTGPEVERPLPAPSGPTILQRRTLR